MENISEVQVLTNVRLSHAQKYVLAKLMLPNQTPLIAYTNVSTGKNVVANRDVLVKLGMVIVGANEAEITEQGKAALQNENLVDDMGNLTPQGEQYAYAKDLAAVEQIAAQEKPPEMPSPEAEPAQEPKPMGIAPEDTRSAEISFESWSMISSIQEELMQKEFLKTHTSKTNS